MVPRFLTCFVAASLAWNCALALAQEAVPATSPGKKDPSPEEVTKIIEGGDEHQLPVALAQIDKWLARGRAPKDLRATWLPALLAKKRYDDVLRISLEAIAASPQTTNVQALLELRQTAFTQLDKPAEALACAKSAYNVAEFRRSQRFIDLVIVALKARYPDNPLVMTRFRVEQSEASGRPASPEDRKLAVASKDAGPPSPILKSVQIDASLYDAALRQWKHKDKSFGDRLCYANLLLIADRPKEAEEIFRDLLNKTPGEADRATAQEGVARALRAQDGTLARANAFLQSPLPSPSTLP